MKVLLFATHPIQYQIPIYQNLTKHVDLKVIYMLKPTKKDQSDAGFGVEFEWDIPLLKGYQYKYLTNLSTKPSSSNMNGIILDDKEINDLFKKEKPTNVIIHGWFPKGLKQIINYCYRHKIKSICRGDSTLLMTSNPLKKILKEVYIRTLLRKIDDFLYVGIENKKYYTHFGINKENLYPGFHCINTPFFENYFENSIDRKFDKSKIIIGFVGKFIAIKQPLILLEAISQSKYKSIIKTIFIGDGPLRNDIESYSKQHQLNMEVTGFLNQTEIVEKGYKNIDTLVLPSKSETWGLVVNEVMTGGIPAIVSNKVGCHSDLIDEGKTGYTFKEGNTLDLRDKIDLFIEKKISGHSFEIDTLKKIKDYSLENTVKGYLNILKY